MTTKAFDKFLSHIISYAYKSDQSFDTEVNYSKFLKTNIFCEDIFEPDVNYWQVEFLIVK